MSYKDQIQDIGKDGQPKPLSGSHKVKNKKHSRQKHNKSHDM